MTLSWSASQATHQATWQTSLLEMQGAQCRRNCSAKVLTLSIKQLELFAQPSTHQLFQPKSKRSKAVDSLATTHISIRSWALSKDKIFNSTNQCSTTSEWWSQVLPRTHLTWTRKGYLCSYSKFLIRASQRMWDFKRTINGPICRQPHISILCHFRIAQALRKVSRSSLSKTTAWRSSLKIAGNSALPSLAWSMTMRLRSKSNRKTEASSMRTAKTS